MKKLISLLLVIPMLLASCVNLDEIKDRLEKHEDRIKNLEALVKNANTSIETLQKLVDAEAGKLSITSYEALPDGSGYVLTMSDGSKITLSNGADGIAPNISVIEKDGVLYWALDGELLLDAKGNPIPCEGADGKAGVTPKIRVSRDGEWEMSIDGGVTWQKVLDENGKPVKAVGSDATIDLKITETDEYITIEWNGQTFVISKTAVVAVVSVSVEPTSLTLVPNETVTLQAIVLPDNASDKSVTWSSDKESVATVDAQGVVQAVAVGSATITATTTDGQHKATCTVTVEEPTATVKLAIEYVADYNVNLEGTGFVSTHSNTEAGIFTYGQAMEKFGWDKDFKVNGVAYHLPSIEEFRGIVPEYNSGRSVSFKYEDKNTAVSEVITIAGITKTYTADYISPGDGNAYGLRFKGDDESQRSAWRYEYLDNPDSPGSTEKPQKMLKITVRRLGGSDTGITVETIADPSWWASNNTKDIVKIFPAAGFLQYAGDENLTNAGTHGYYWSSTEYNTSSARSMDFFDQGAYTSYYWNGKSYKYSVRLFSNK